MNNTTQKSCYARPDAYIAETDSGYVAEVELPGVTRENLQITFEQGELTIVGRRTKVDVSDKAEWLHRESHGADFKRAFELDSSIDASAINASLEHGLLTLRLPKSQAATARRIEINGLN